jgi:D-alanyl-D-alanine carboxypeptidase
MNPSLRFPLALVGLFLSSVAPAVAEPDAIDKVVLSEMKRQFSPAVGIAVVSNGKVVKAKGYGHSNVEHMARATEQTVFQTGSVGKQFTAALVLLLVRDGKLTLDDPITKHLSDAPESWKGITLRHLLTHTAGLPATDDAIDLRKDYTEQQLLSSAYRVPLVGTPGQAHKYSNLGYQVIGVLCSKVGGRFWGDQLRERVFSPLGMRSRVISERDIVRNRAAGYDRYDGELENQTWVAPSQNTTADGSLYVTPQDMARWALALDRESVLTKREKDFMWTRAALDGGQTVDYGFGWKLFEDAGHRIVRHRGDWQGFAAHIMHLPEDRLTITVLMNRARAQPHAIADKIAALYVPALRKPPVRPPSVTVLGRTPLFLRGAMNDWTASLPFTEVAPGILQAKVELQAGMQQFKVAAEDWKVAALGARFDEALVRLDRAQPLEHDGEDLFLEASIAGTYVFELNLHDGRAPLLKVIGPRVTRP